MENTRELSLVKKYCQTLDESYLQQLSKVNRVMFAKLAGIAKTIKTANQEVADAVIRSTERKFDREISRDKAEHELQRMPVGVTGARAGDILVGCHAGTKGAMIKVLDRDIPPGRGILDRIRPFPELWQKFLTRLGSFEFFSGMSDMGKEIWLELSENDNDYFADDDAIQLLQPGSGDAIKKQGSIFSAYLPGDVIDDIMSRDRIEPGQLNSIVVEYTGKTSTLVFLKTFWALSTSHQIVSQFAGPVIDVYHGAIKSGQQAGPNEEIILIDNLPAKYERDEIVRKQTVGFLVSKKRLRLAKIDTNNEILQQATVGFTAAAYKSLLQKIIRFRPRAVTIGSISVPANDVLTWTFLSLLKHPGAFVPNIQRFVGGLESAVKRLAISIYEDSSIPADQYNWLLSLLSAGLVAQRVKDWTPDEKMLQNWLHILNYAYETPELYVTDWKKELAAPPYTVDSTKSILVNCSAILDELRSFPSDLALARGWAKNYTVTVAAQQPESMPLYHCIDQHFLPAFIYYLSPEVAESYRDKIVLSSEPFGPLFKDVFHRVTGINSRRHYSIDFESQPFVREIHRAQELTQLALQTELVSRPTGDEFIRLKYHLPDSWIAGMIGVIRVNVGRTRIIVTLKTDNPLDLVAVREPPARSSKAEYKQLEPEQEEEAIEIARDRLKRGLPLNQCTPPIEQLVGAKAVLRLIDDEWQYVIMFADGSEKLWSAVRNIRIKVPIHPAIKHKMKTMLTSAGTGLEQNYDQSIDDLVQSLSPRIIQRVLVYLTTSSSRIELNHISREGGSTNNYSVNLDDVAAYRTLLTISAIAPGAIRPTGPAAFTVVNRLILWHVRDMINSRRIGSAVDSGQWGQFADESRQPYEYQINALNDMIANYQKGLRGNFLWLPLGSGKTFLVLNYLKYLNEEGKLPPFIIYTLPPESALSIIAEIKYFSLPINVIIPLKSIGKKKDPYIKAGVKVSQSCVPLPYHVNLIFHDYLKNCKDELSQIAGDSVIIFDEVHLFLNQTLRTGMGMNLARLSRLFVALTGTPIVDNKMEKLITWLEQIVPFEVNKRNFWVAANNMIAKEITTGLQTESKNVTATFTDEENREYLTLVPPALGGNNHNPRSSDWLKAAEICYQACDRKMIKLTKNMLGKDRGVMLVARSLQHQDRLHEMLVEEKVLPAEQIFLIRNNQSIFLTDETVKSRQTPDYKVVIVPKNRAQGYTLTRLSVMITSVYPSNSATREQLKGRINRLGQKTQPLLYRTVHTGVLSLILENHNQAGNLLQALQAIANNV